MSHPSNRAPVFNDPISRRITFAVIGLVAYGLLWKFYWRPAGSAVWVNGAIVAAILIGTLPPEPIRSFAATAAYFAIAVIMQVMFGQTPAAVVLGLGGCFSLYNGVGYLKQMRR